MENKDKIDYFPKSCDAFAKLVLEKAAIMAMYPLNGMLIIMRHLIQLRQIRRKLSPFRIRHVKQVV